MADIYVKMVGEDDSPDKCREARRRRIEMRRFSAVAGDSPSTAGSLSRRAERKREAEAAESDPSTDGGEKRSRPAWDDSPTPPPPPSSATPSSPSTSSSPAESTGAPATASCSAPAPAQAPAVEPRLAFGSISLSGRLREMEDAVSVQPGFFRPPGGGSMLHFFAVFDGHGGSHVSALCKERMHVILAEELAAAGEAEATEEDRWRAAVARSFERMDELALTACVCGNVGHPPCRCERSGIESDIVGSTAVVAVVSRDRLLVANCGDSRAVLSRAGRAVPLSCDHKPDRPDELARIEAAGGRVIFLNGARVHGILAMSRALENKMEKFVMACRNATVQADHERCLSAETVVSINSFTL
ncbi:probable protein phosphatase 2C 75 isoform X2 [Phoenix dactylifera]|uniref:protein-serine/threonine phosphatase n=1 Tax=Phoenix dactylifera TaxID=42345 RepID=A0A8B9A7M4_PHODC|nr:probable protein phosphatase 2C 75 isoform X2 [Phoenix dactylifera]